jgi:hypothetical protein
MASVAIYNQTRYEDSFNKYTCWNFFVQLFYFGWAAKYQWYHCRASTMKDISLSAEGHRLNALLSICLPLSLMVIIVYYGYLFDPKDFSWTSIVQHGVNTVLLLIEFSLNHCRIEKGAWVYMGLLTGTYVAFVWILHDATSMAWPYSFFDMTDKFAPLWFVGIFLIHALTFGFAVGLSTLKQRYVPQQCLRGSTHVDNVAQDDVMCINTPPPLTSNSTSTTAYKEEI